MLESGGATRRARRLLLRALPLLPAVLLLLLLGPNSPCSREGTETHKNPGSSRPGHGGCEAHRGGLLAAYAGAFLLLVLVLFLLLVIIVVLI